MKTYRVYGLWKWKCFNGHPDHYFERFLLIIQLYFQIVYPVSLLRTLPLQLSWLTSEDHIIVPYRFLYSLYVYFPQRIQRMKCQSFLYLHQTEFFHCVVSVFLFFFPQSLTKFCFRFRPQVKNI